MDNLRLEHGLSAVDQTDAQDASQRKLYRTDAVDRLRDALTSLARRRGCGILILSRKPLGFL